MKRTFSILCAAALCFGCGQSADSKRPQLLLISDEEMNQMGTDAYEEILAESPVSNDPRETGEIVEVGSAIAQVSGKQDYDWRFSLLRDDQANAFCLPGGKVAIYTGLLPYAQNNAGLAAVLGHEVAHALLRHSAERMSEQLLQQGALSLVGLTYQNSAYRDLIAAALGIGSEVGISLPFSRLQEKEADRLGLQLMAKAGYDPREAVNLWNRMSEAGERMPQILSTHPDPKSRMEDLQKHMPEAIELYNQSSHRPTMPL
ncbi:MAG TPA: M48 family metallopeptidase [Oligoflexus sp.]|uniref:M48 family metallopeptidase n=1 Tax=Oligoflexus sp. TaxID=1971216 RepID=UPI002D7EB0E0|nr:M48 family metallopeptidase [Oligoflexus sp.]HET9236622.1 M48 family metallopeptidase [Oligoflexus sp.]